MKRVTNSRPAFSLIELMVVILIIALIVAILLPALGGVRQKSRDAATRNLLQNLSQAFASFEIDNKRLPGYFPESALGAPENGQTGRRGLTSLENAMFELAGGIDPTRTTAGQGWAKVGPYSDDTKNVFFNDDAVGKGKYFVPPAQNYKKVNGSEVGLKVASATSHLDIKDVVDNDGMPIIAWMADPSAIGPITAMNQVAAVSSTGTSPARFYMNSNHAMLAATGLGKKGVNQDTESLIGFGGNPANDSYNLAAIAGAPGSPKDINQPLNNILPTGIRGSFMLQAAGKNGVYMGRNERGGARVGGPTNTLYYGLNFKNFPDTRLLDSDGKPTSADIVKDFDDIVVSGGA